MKQFVMKYPLSFIKKSTKDIISQEILGLTCIFDLNGDLQEFAIDFPKELNIPMAVIDELFDTVLSGNIRCTYKKDHPGLKDARFISYSGSYYLEKLLQE